MFASMGRVNRRKNDNDRELPEQEQPEREQPAGPASWDTIRVSKVKRARELANDPNYPSRATLDAVAELLARKLETDAAENER